MDHLMNVYRRLNVTFERGEGVWLWDTEGNKYLDALSGIAVTGLGHANPAVTKAIQEQAAKLLHTSNLYQIANQKRLAAELCRLSGLDLAFFCNSGAEAVEAALKLSRLYGHGKGIEFPHVVVMTGSFHGRTLATISAGANKKAQAGFEPLVEGFLRAQYNSISALQDLAEKHNNIVAVLLEPVQGESGIRVPDPGYLKAVRELCDQKGWLLILDEVQSGMGRTGTFYAYQSDESNQSNKNNTILPDIITMAKGLANGVPIGACLAKKEIGQIFQPGNHGSTFGGNPLACAAALATIQEIEKHKYAENAKKQGALLLKGLQEKLKGHPNVKEIRGKGLMIGIELDKPCRDILNIALKKGLLFNIAGETVIRLLPPLIIEKEHVDMIVHLLPEIIAEYSEQQEKSPLTPLL